MEFDVPNPRTQDTREACFPTSLKIILEHLSQKQRNTKINLPLKRINKHCFYVRGVGVDIGDIEAGILSINNDLKKFNYVVFEASGRNSDINLLKQILNNPDSSAPIVFLGAEYFTEQIIGYEVPEIPEHDYEHTIIVRRIADTEIVIYDPFKPFLEKSTRVPEIKTSIKIVNFLKYWSKASNHIVWIQKISSSNLPSLPPSQKSLSAYIPPNIK